jgi:Tfp pilus assembly protein FimT
MRILSTIAAAAAMLLIAAPAFSQQKEISDAQYMEQALSAAPPAVAAHATVVRMDKDGKMRTLRKGTDGFTCMILGADRMCNDANAMEFFSAVMNHTAPPEGLGISYMLAGDHGASNTDPYAKGNNHSANNHATEKRANNHWIVTGPHLMIVGAAAKGLGYTREADPDPGKPYMMWVGTPYEHAMVPVGPPSASKP